MQINKQKTNETDRIDRLYSSKEVSKMWGLPKTRIYKLVNDGQLRPIVNMGKGYKWVGNELAVQLVFERL